MSPTVVFQRAWHEWRPECECGWVGSYWKSEASARGEAAAHSSTIHPEQPP